MKLRNAEKQPNENNSLYAYRVLRENIMTFVLAPGEPLNEGELSDALSISRTPIREAVFRLRDERLVDVFPQKLSRVSLIDLDLVREGIFMRITMEPAVVGLACGSLSAADIGRLAGNLDQERRVISGAKALERFYILDNEFHKIIYDAVGRSWVWRMVHMISTHYDRVRYFDVLLGNDRLKPIYEEHRELYDIMVSGRRDANPKELIEKHLSGYQNVLPRVLEEYGNYFCGLEGKAVFGKDREPAAAPSPEVRKPEADSQDGAAG